MATIGDDRDGAQRPRRRISSSQAARRIPKTM